jgi:hypothetical protein
MAKRALLIGINKYQIPGADLRGCVNDVKDLSAALVEFHGFKKGDITMLVDGAATQKDEGGDRALLRGAKGDTSCSTTRPRSNARRQWGRIRRARRICVPPTSTGTTR